MFNNFGLHVTNILKKMEEERSKLNHPFVGSEHLLLSVLNNDKEISKKFLEYDITYESFKAKLIKVVGKSKKNVDFNLYTPLLKRVINNSIEDAAEDNDGEVTTNHLIRALLEEGEGIAIRIIVSEEVDLDELYNSFKGNINKEKNKKNEFGKNLNRNVDVNEITVGREKEIKFIIETLLRKKKNNPLLIGDAGVGKTAIVEEFARMINKKAVPKELSNMEIISLEMSNLVAGTKYRGEFEEKLTKIIEDLEKNKKYILFIDEIHTMVSAGGAEGAISAGDIFKPYLARGNIKCIGATTTEEYEKYIAKDKALSRRFETILIKEPTLEETINILFEIKEEYEKHHNVKISKKNVDSIVKHCDNYIFNKKNPDKSIDFLDSVCTMVHVRSDNTLKINKCLNKLSKLKKNKKFAIEKNDYNKAINIHEEELKVENLIKLLNEKNSKNISEKDILKVLEKKSNIPLMQNKDKILINLENDLKEEFELETVNKVKKIFDTKISNMNKNYLYLITSNSNKINLQKCLSKTLNDKMNIIKINGSEYSTESMINKLIGTPGGYVGYNDTYILSQIKQKPYSLILIENFDYLTSNVKELFYNIKENGYFTDSKGEKINCNNILVISFITNSVQGKIGFMNNSAIAVNETIGNDIEKFDEIINIPTVKQKSHKQISL